MIICIGGGKHEGYWGGGGWEKGSGKTQMREKKGWKRIKGKKGEEGEKEVTGGEIGREEAGKGWKGMTFINKAKEHRRPGDWAGERIHAKMQYRNMYYTML